MRKGDSKVKGVMLRMLRFATSFLFVSVLVLGLTSCEEEPPPMQRGGGPDPAGSPAAPQPAAPGEPEKTSAQDGKTAAGSDSAAANSTAAGAEGANAEKPADAGAESLKKPGVLPPRVPSASEMLGMDRDDNQKPAVDRLPTFLQSNGTKNPKLLFDGDEPSPSDAYAAMGQDGMLEVSPLERHWGGALRVSDVGAKRKLLTNSMAAPQDDDETALFGPGAALEATDTDTKADTGTKVKSESDKQFELKMYRLNRQNLKVESVTRTYATAAARDAAKSFLRKDGYSDKPPSPAAVQQLRDAQKKKDEKKKASANQKNACPFRATYTENGVTNSRCFSSAEALSKFQQSLQKKRQAKLKKQSTPARANVGDSRLRQNPIKPVKLD